MGQRRYIQFSATLHHRLHHVLVLLVILIAVQRHLHRRLFVDDVVVHQRLFVLLFVALQRRFRLEFVVFAVQRAAGVVAQVRIARLLRLQLAVVQTAVPADLHFALDVHGEGVGELEGVEEGVRDDGGAFVGAARF